MLKLRITLLCLISFVGMAAAWEKTENGFRFNCGELTRTVEFYGNNSLRVTATLRGVSHAKHPSITVVAGPTKVPLEIKAEGEHCIVAVSPAVTIRADRKSGALAFFRPDGEVILRENTETPVSIKEVTISDAPTYEVKQHFRPTPDEGLYGLGQCVSPTLNLRGQEIWVVQTNIPAFTPVFTSSNRYGILWDIASQSIFHDGKDGLSLWAESAPAGADYYLMTGKDLDAVLGEYRMLTGAAPMFPKQAFGFFMSKERYKSQQELIGIVEEFRRDGFPIDWIVKDWQ